MNLSEMLMGDMLDVIHFFYEDDMIPKWEREIEVKSGVRSIIYKEIYNTVYKYSISEDSGPNGVPGFGFDGEPTGTVKPYIPPTDPEDLASILDPPLS